MKKVVLLGALICIVLSLSSCVTAITNTRYINPYDVKNVYDQPLMDFIGYKVDSNILSTATPLIAPTSYWGKKNGYVMSEFDQAKDILSTQKLRLLGSTLEKKRIANNKDYAYFGIYSLQELELFKSDTRYVTFVEAVQSKIDYKENNNTKYTYGALGGSLVGYGLTGLIAGAALKDEGLDDEYTDSFIGLGTISTIVGAICLVPAFKPSKTELEYYGIYNIYIYDTQSKSVIKKESVYVDFTETFDGSYSYNDDSKKEVTRFISTMVSNKLLQKYDELSVWLKYKE